MEDLKVYYAVEDGNTLAVFLNEDELPKYTAFTLRGFHSVTSPDYVLELQPAKPAMYAEIHDYLSKRYADPYFSTPFNLVPVSRDEFKVYVEKH